uniref:Uncharacterized protein n=1 Tax=Ananas comosus var. bracteatus TaxID=296719 RepID=A0A6V7PAB6_ANACO|nr:unnamed protein product [Ananas comosus var. bracteatus]
MRFRRCARCFTDVCVARAPSTVVGSALKGEHGLRHAETCQQGFYVFWVVAAAVDSMVAFSSAEVNRADEIFVEALSEVVSFSSSVRITEVIWLKSEKMKENESK